jgi:hypothetical protein
MKIIRRSHCSIFANDLDCAAGRCIDSAHQTLGSLGAAHIPSCTQLKHEGIKKHAALRALVMGTMPSGGGGGGGGGDDGGGGGDSGGGGGGGACRRSRQAVRGV